MVTFNQDRKPMKEWVFKEKIKSLIPNIKIEMPVRHLSRDVEETNVTGIGVQETTGDISGVHHLINCVKP